MSKNLTQWKKFLLIDDNCYLYLSRKANVSVRLMGQNYKKALEFYGLDNDSLVHINDHLCIKLDSNPMELPEVYIWEETDADGNILDRNRIQQRNWLFQEAKKYYEEVRC